MYMYMWHFVGGVSFGSLKHVMRCRKRRREWGLRGRLEKEGMVGGGGRDR